MAKPTDEIQCDGGITAGLFAVVSSSYMYVRGACYIDATIYTYTLEFNAMPPFHWPGSACVLYETVRVYPGQTIPEKYRPAYTRTAVYEHKTEDTQHTYSHIFM